jgi:hypothetical protein
MNALNHVQNGTYENDDSMNLGRIRVIETKSGIEIKHYITDCERLVYEFSAFAVKTAQSTLEMCRVVYEAKRALEGQEFLKFCNVIGRNGEDATVRKYLKIGEKYDQFYQYAKLLPNSWTSIYEITQLPTEIFEALVTTENSMANMTGAQIKALMGKGADDKSRSSAANASPMPTAVQNSTEASNVIDAASSSTDAIQADTDTSAAIQTASIEPVSEFGSESVGIVANESVEQPSDDSDCEFAKQAINAMLERVATASSSNIEVEAAIESDEILEPYEVTLRFNSKPSYDALAMLVESVLSLKSKYRLDVEIVTQIDLVT